MKNKKNAGEKSKFKYIMKLVLMSVSILLSLTIIAVALMVFGVINITNNIDMTGDSLIFTSFIYYKDAAGNDVVYEPISGSQNRKKVELNQMPIYLQQAVIAIEDERFYEHIGVDFKSTSKAVFDYVFRRPGGRGASTLTQQVIKNVTGNSQVKVSRKATEIVQALAIERKYSKDEILELYLNTMYLSEGCYGVGAAAEFYFGKKVEDLDLAECALLAGITQYPSKYDPMLNEEASLEKRNLVLAQMLKLGYISDAQHNAAASSDIKLNPNSSSNTSRQSYFTDQVVVDVLDALQNKLGMSEKEANNMLYSGGLKIYGTLDVNVQNAMTTVFKDNSNFPSVKAGATLPQAAMVVIDPYTGAVKGIVGGRGEKTAALILNRATGAYRQPGSSIKPIAAYAPGVELGLISPTTTYEDKLVQIGSWAPKNWYSGYRGEVTIRYALEQSINTIAVQVMQNVGVDYCYKFLKDKLHFNSLTEADKSLSLALGGVDVGVTVLEMTAGYASFANDGVYTEPYTFTKIVDNKGKVVYQTVPEASEAMKKSTAKAMNSMLRTTVTSGLASSANFSSNYDICGKTGTTDDSKDRWFMGYTPYYAGGVWFGYDQPATLNFSGNPALNLWKKVMTEIHKGLPSKRFDLSGVPYASNPVPSPSNDLDPDASPLVSGSVIPSDSLPTESTPPSQTATPSPVLPTHSSMIGL